MSKRRMALAALLAAALLLSGCGGAQTQSLEPPVHTPERTVIGRSTPAPEPTPSPEPTPEPTPDPVLEKLRSMSLEEKTAQMLLVNTEALTGVSGRLTEVDEATRRTFDQIPVCGVLYNRDNLESPEQTRALCADMQELSRERIGLPAFICVDEEGGTVARISGNAAFGVDAVPDMAEVGATGEEEAARAVGRLLGGSLRALGFTVDFAPVADVLSEPENTVVRDRSFGWDAELVTQLARACAEGLLEEGVLPAYKHFPGHGSTAGDSHEGIAVSWRTREELEACDLLPFRDAAERGVPFIMVGHISFPNITGDWTPASLSPVLLRGILRDELGYGGVIVTDALNMRAVRDNYSIAQTVRMAVEAGNDILLVFEDVGAYHQALLDAVADGSIPEERIDESVERILRLKLGEG